MLVLGVVGDYGVESKQSMKVATLVKSWKPKIIITTGDNLYSQPSEKNYASIVGKMYGEYLEGYEKPGRYKRIGKEGPQLLLHDPSTRTSIPTNMKFFPSVGNHDYPFNSYCNYFHLPTYYATEFIHHPKLLKCISLNNYGDSDGSFETFSLKQKSKNRSTLQQKWLENELEQSADFRWIIVYFHYPQCCSNQEDVENEQNRRFPFYKYPNVALCLSGHHHIYERLGVNGVTQVVIGTGGHSIRKMAADRVPQSLFCDDSGFGGLKLAIDYKEIRGSYYVVSNNCTMGRKTTGRKNGQDGPNIGDSEEQEPILKDVFTIVHKCKLEEYS